MATAFTEENENFCRLVVLVNEKGLDALRASLEFFSTQKYKVATFQNVLQDPTVFRKLTKLRGKPISPYQWKVLYPVAGTVVTMGDLDITLCFLLIKHVSGLKQPITGWDKPPAKTDVSLEGGLAHIKFLRNTLCHKDSPSFSNPDFVDYYNDFEKALLNIEQHLPSWHITKADIRNFKTLPISPQQQHDVDDLVQKWGDEEKDMFVELAKIGKQIEETSKRAEKIDKQTQDTNKKMEKIDKQTEDTSKKTEKIDKQTEDTSKRTEEIHKHLLASERKEPVLFLPIFRMSNIERIFGRPITKRKFINYLKKYYKTEMGKIQRIPWEEDDTFDLRDMYVKLCQVIIDKKTGKQEIYLDHYSQMITESTCVNVIIQGHAGMGKTTLVSKFGVDWANGVWSSLKWWKDHFPLILKLRDLTNEDNFADAIKKQLFNGLDVTSQEIFEFIKIYSTQIVLLLDGFDEFPTNGSIEIKGLIKQEWFKDMSMILTTRPWRTKEVQDSWDKLVEIKGFKKADVDVYIDNFFKTIPNGLTMSENFKREIEKKQYYPLFETPVIILFNCLVFLDEEKIYSRLTYQYKAVINCMKKRASAKGHKLDDEIYLKIEDLALEGLLAGEKGLIFSAQELKNRFGNDIFHLGIFTVMKRPDRGIQNLEFVFIHKTLQEYQAACSLVRTWGVGNQNELQKVEKHCQNPSGILEMGKLLQFCCSLNLDLKTVILLWFTRILQSCSNQYRSTEKFIVIELTKETADICEAYHGCVTDHSKATEELRKGEDEFLPIAEKYNYSILFHKESGNILGLTSADVGGLLESIEALTRDENELDITKTDQLLIFDCDFSAHSDHEVYSVISYMNLCKYLKRIRITSSISGHGLNGVVEPLLNTEKPTLEELIINKNKISSQSCTFLAEQFKSMPKLKKLDVSDNHIGEKGAKMIGENLLNIPNIEDLMLKGNGISSEGCSLFAEHLISVPKLKKLDVSDNRIGDKGAKGLGENFQFIPNLEELIIDRNDITVNGCSFLADNFKLVPKLKKLYVSRNSFGEKGAKVLGVNFHSTPNLEELFINGNCISLKGCSLLAKQFKSLPKLKKLGLDDNNITDNGAKMLGENFRFVPNLAELYIQRNSITAFGCSLLARHYKSVPNLKILDVSDNRIGDEGANVLGEHFQFIPNLEKLFINGNDITSEGCSLFARHFKSVPKLKKLDISDNIIGDKGAKALGENCRFIPNLQVQELSIDRNSVSVKGRSLLAEHIKSVPKRKSLKKCVQKIK